MTERPSYPLLAALAAEGAFSRQGEWLSQLDIAVRGETLEIRGVLRVWERRSGAFSGGEEYCYRLTGENGERLLSAARADFPQPFPHAVAQQFELSHPERPLKDYLDLLGLRYEYDISSGEPP